MGSVRPVKYGEVRKINVVYFLSRDGQVEHPHLLKIYPVVQSRVRLRDIKKWLSNVRGKDMPDKFSWSYKRRYKTGYVWQDLCDDDLVTPMSDNEYILKGSEILIESTESCKACSNDKKRSIVQIEGTQEQDLPLDTLELDLSVPPDIGNKGQTAKKSYSFDGYSSKEIQPVKSTEKSMSFNEDYQLAVEYIAKLNGGGLGSPNDSGEVIRVYKAITSCEKVDAEAQTGDSQRQIIVAEKNSGLTVKSETEGETQVSPKDIEYQDSRVAFEEEDVSRVKIDFQESRVSSGEQLSNSTEISKDSRDIAENGNQVKSKNEEVKKGNSDNDQSGVASATSVKEIVCEQRASLERITRSYSKLSCAKNDVVVAFNENGQPSPKTKKAAASQVIKQLFACGGTETKNSAIKNIKSLSITRSLSNQSRLTTPRSSDSLSVLKASDAKDSPRNISQR